MKIDQISFALIMALAITTSSGVYADCFDDSQRIDELRSDINLQQSSLESYEQDEGTARNAGNSCSGYTFGMGACQSVANSVGNAELTIVRQKEDDARQKIRDDEREMREIKMRGCPNGGAGASQ